MQNLITPTALCVLLASTLAATPALAKPQDASEAEEAVENEYEEEVFVLESLPYVPESNTVLTKLPLESDWTPANIGIVDLETLTEQDVRVLGDALENVSGTNVQTGQGIFDFFVLRGFDSLTSGLVLTDGAPEPEATFYQMYNTERVEVFKGPAGFLYGSNPLAGVVNLVRKQPVPQNFGSIALGAGSFGAVDTNVDWNRASKDGRASFRLNGLYRSGDGHRDGREFDVTALNPAFSWRPNEATSVHLNIEALASDYVPDAGLPIIGGQVAAVPRDRSYAWPLDFSEQDVSRIQLDIEHRISDQLELRNKLYLRELDWRTDGTLLSGVFPSFTTGRLEVFRTLVALDDKQDFTGNQFELLWSPEGSRHQILAGLEIARFADKYSLDVGILPSLDLLDPAEPAVSDIFFLPSQSARGDSESDVIAPYVIDKFQATDKFLVLAGVRLDSIDFEDRPSATSRSQEEVSPMLGLVYSPASDSAIYVNAARSFAPPSPRVVGERNAEESQQLEVGFRRTWAAGKARSTVAVFQIDRENIAIPDDNGFTQQAGDQRSKGLELDLAGELGAGVEAQLTYAYTDSELTRFSELVLLPFSNPPFAVFDRSGNRSAFAPEHLANVWLSKAYGNGLRVGGGLRYVDDQFIAEDNATSIDGFTLLNAALSYGRDSWRLGLRLRNLTDEDYETRGFGTTAVIPGEPFSASVSFEFRL